ncbi:hypothetical protein KC336_g14417 [Hortaea werneckii]|nr:hypothetical protein KC336_g14417 [Hortaea werneckii]
MPATAQSAYFPSLDRCLTGAHRIISWKSAYHALSDDLEAVRENSTLQDFLSDDESVAILSKPFQPFERPSANTRSAFDTRVAPINISQSANGDCNLEEIKKDAVWLSEKLSVDETSCLRIAILEWQQRPADLLFEGPQKAAAKPNADLRSSFLASTASLSASTNRVETLGPDFSKEETRRERQVHIYGEERLYSLKLTADLVSYGGTQGSVSLRRSSSWLDELAARITDQFCAPALDFAESQKSITQSVDCVAKFLQVLHDRSQWPKAFTEGENAALEEDYISSMLLNVACVLRIILAQLYSLSGPPGGEPVLKWFNLMKVDQYQHLQGLQPTLTLPDVSHIQSLASMVSLAMLAPAHTIPSIQESASTQSDGAITYPQLPNQQPFYIKDETVSELHKLFLYSVAEGVDLALPAVYAWALIVKAIRDIAIPLSQARHEEGPGDAEPGDLRRQSRTGQQDTQAERQWELLQREVPSGLPGEAKTDPAVFLLERSVGPVYGLVPTLGTTIGASFTSGAGHLDQTSLIAREGLCLLLKEGFEVVGYSSEVFDAFTAAMQPSIKTTGLDDRHDNLPNLLAGGDLSYLLNQAMLRYPFELSPFLRILAMTARAESESSAGSANVVQQMEDFKSVTIMVPMDFRDFRLENEEANTNEMILTDTVSLFVPKQKAMSFDGERRLLMDRAVRGAQDAEGNLILLPAGASGQILREDKPIVLLLEHKHSGLEYLGLLLSTLLPTSELVPAPPAPQLDQTTAAEIVVLINALTLASLRQEQGVEEAKVLMGRLSYALPNEQDIITIISDIFEMELLSYLDQSFSEGSLDFLVACTDFWNILVEVSPERVWSMLNRSSLLGASSGTPTALAAVVGGVEAPSGVFRFLATCTNLYSHLVDNTIAGLIKRKPKEAGSSKAVARRRFDSPFADQLSATPERTIKDVLTAWQRIMLDAYQNMSSWRFIDMEEKQGVAESMMTSFEGIVRVVFGLETQSVHGRSESFDSSPARQSLGDLLRPAAEMTMQAFAPTSASSSLANSTAALLSDGLLIADDLLASRVRQKVQSQVKSTCTSLARILRTARTNEDPMRAVSLSRELAKCVPIFAKLFAVAPLCKGDLVALLHEVVSAFATTNTDVSSLLGHLDSDSAQSFLRVITQLDRPLPGDVDTEIILWDFFTAVLESTQSAGGQAAFGMYLLTGMPPRANRDAKASIGYGKDNGQTKSMLNYALDELTNLSAMNPRRAAAMLKFIAVAQSVWAWATVSVRSHADFLTNCLAWLYQLQPPPRAANNAEALICSNELTMAAHLCEILAVNLHASLQTGDSSVLKMLSPKLSFLQQYGNRVDAYNRSLHRNLNDNLTRKYPACELTDFKRSPANPAPHGRNFYYDLDLANAVLSYETLSWYGDEDLRSQGYEAEVTRANINLSLVDAQKRLLDSWKQLATVLSEFAEHDTALQPVLAKAASACLSANVEANIDEPGTADVLQARAELAFILLSKLIGMKCSDSVMKDILPTAWELVRTSPVDYDVATAEDDLRYYRVLLQILFLSLKPHAYIPLSPARAPRATDAQEEPKSTLPVSTSNNLLEIINRTILPGFRALCGNLHTDLQTAQPADFALLTALFKSILSVQGITLTHAQIAEHVIRSGVVRGALSLYSWADQLAQVTPGQDPVYGEVAVHFILTLSSVSGVGEQMALDGVLAQLGSANLSNYFRKRNGKDPFDEPVRMFAIWNEGFLPLCLNLLDAVGPAIAGEVAAFLNSFPEQLARAADAFKTELPPYRRKLHSGNLSLGLLREAKSLIMIAMILQSDVARAAAEGLNANEVPLLEYDLGNAKAEMEKLSRTQRSLADKIIATNEREAVLAKTPGSGSFDTLLQGLVVQEVHRCLALLGE